MAVAVPFGKGLKQISGADGTSVSPTHGRHCAVCSTSSPYSCPAGSPTWHESDNTIASLLGGDTPPPAPCFTVLVDFVLAWHPLQMVRVPGPHVDVNVHPTKREVSFLFEDRLVEAVCAALQQALTNTTSR